MAAHDIGLARNRQTGNSSRLAALSLAVLAAGWAPAQDRSGIAVKSPLVLVVGCATTTAKPHVWILARAGLPQPSSTVGITVAEKQELPKRSLGQHSYELIGVADFVDVAATRQIGDRGAILSPERVNATGQLVNGSKVAVKGLYIEGSPPRINLTSVANLARSCP